MNDWTTLNLKPGDILRVAQKHVTVYSESQKKYRYFSLNGKYMGSVDETQMRINPDECCIFGDDCIWIKKEDGLWQMLDYEGKDIWGGYIKNVTFSEIAKCASIVFNECSTDDLLPLRSNQYLTLAINDDEVAIYSITGECLLERGFYKNVTVYENYAFLTAPDNSMKLYNLITKTFVGECYTDITILGKAIILKTPDKYYMFSLVTGNIVEEFKVYLMEQIEWADTTTFGLWLYRKGQCGFWLCSSTYLKQVFPIEYVQIILDGEEGVSARGKYCRHIDIKHLMKADDDVNENFENTREDDETYATIMYNAVEVKTGDVLKTAEKFFTVSKDTKTWDEKMWYGQKMGLCYTLEGEFIGKTTVLYNGYDEILDFSCIELENYLVLSGCTKEQLKHDVSSKAWCIYDFDAKEFLPNVFTNVFSDSCNKYLICNAPCFRHHDKSVMYVFSLKTEKLLFKLDGYRNPEAILGEYFEILDFNNELWIFDENGEKIFENGISFSFFNMHGMVVERRKCDFVFYDCVNRKRHFMLADTCKALYGQYAKKIFELTRYNKHWLYAYSEEKGFYQVIPAGYDFVQVMGDYILAQNLLEDLTDDIYDFDGMLISSTKLNK